MPFPSNAAMWREHNDLDLDLDREAIPSNSFVHHKCQDVDRFGNPRCGAHGKPNPKVEEIIVSFRCMGAQACAISPYLICNTS